MKVSLKEKLGTKDLMKVPLKEQLDTKDSVKDSLKEQLGTKFDESYYKEQFGTQEKRTIAPLQFKD